MKPIFPNVEQILKILMDELPEGTYAIDLADDPDFEKRSYSSSELRATSQMLSDLYQNLSSINADLFISTVTPEGLGLWEKELFATAQDASQPFDVRQQNLITKRRANGGISLPAIAAVVSAILTPKGLAFEILPYCGMGTDDITGGWILEESSLDVGTYLGFLDPLIGAGRDPGITPLDCNLDYAAAGLTAQDLLDIQATAYTYEVKIYGNADASTLALLDQQLTDLEPARSTHVITNNATPPIDPDAMLSDGWPITYGY